MNTSTPTPVSDSYDTARTAAVEQAPQLSHRALTVTLLFMCLVPVVTIFAMWLLLPRVYEGQLEVSFAATGLPSSDFYAIEYYERPPVTGGELLVTNNSDQDWTHLNIQVNGNYSIYDFEPIRAGETRSFVLDRFVSRSGARFSLRYNELKSVRIYARRPTKDRATKYYEFAAGK